jgi:hypothetical protein
LNPRRKWQRKLWDFRTDYLRSEKYNSFRRAWHESMPFTFLIYRNVSLSAP